MPRYALALVLLAVGLIISPARAGDGPADAAKPRLAMMTPDASGVLLAWAPGTLLPDAFRLYGVSNGAFTLLDTAAATDTSAGVQAGFPAYAIKALVGDTESAATFAVGVSVPCVTVSPDPQDPQVGVGCLSHVKIDRRGSAVTVEAFILA